MRDPIVAAVELIADEPLSHEMRIPPLSRSIVKNPAAKIGGADLGLTAAADAGVAIDLFNSERDRDPHGVFAGPGSGAPISYEAQRAWLKYSFRGALKGTVGPELGIVSTAVRSAREIGLLDYRVHRGDERARTALAHDLATPRSILDLDSVRRLAPGEALSIDIGGTLSLVVRFSLADALASAMRSLTPVLPHGVPLAIRLPTEGTTSVTVDLTDDFSFVVSRTEEGRFRISVRKGTSRGTEVTVSARVGAVLTAADTLRHALESVLECVAGLPLHRVRSLLAAGRDGQRGEDDDDALRDLAARLGVAQAFDRAVGVSDAIADLERRIRRAIEAVAKAKAVAGLRYEYSRLREGATLADVVLLDDGELETAWALAMRGDVAALACRSEAAAERYELLRYLDEATLTRRSSYGFTLGLGRHVLEAVDESRLVERVRTDLHGRRMLAFEGARSYREKGVPKPDFTWVADLRAEMTAYDSQPVSDSFDYGLHLQLDFAAVGAGDADRLADAAAMWCAIHEDVIAARRRLEVFLASGDAKATLQIVFERSALAEALGSARANDYAAYGDAFGAAVPYMDVYATRRSHLLRRSTYGQLWAAHFADGAELSVAEWQHRVAAVVCEGGLREFERSPMPNTFAHLLATQYPRVRADRTSFADGLRRLHAAMTSPCDPATIADAFADLERLWSQRPFVAAAGVYLLDLARTAGVLGDVTRTLTVRRDDEALVLTSRA